MRILCLVATLTLCCQVQADNVVDVFTQDVNRFTQLLSSRVPERRVEGVKGLAELRYWPAEEALLKLLQDPSPAVRFETTLALSRLGSAKSVPSLIGLLDNPSWELRQNAWLGLCQMTAQSFPADQKQRWLQWWDTGSPAEKQQALLAAARGPNPAARHEACRALRHMVSAASEPALLDLLQKQPLEYADRELVIDAVERVGTAAAVPILARFPTESSAWALGRIGGPEATRVLLQFPAHLPTLLNLDRAGATNVVHLIPHLVSSMGLLTFRGQPDDLMIPESQPIQRVGGNLIRRSGMAPVFIDAVVRELELSMQPAITNAPAVAVPPAWTPMLEKMRAELKPGFVRDDGMTTSQPLVALYQTATDRALVPRLMPLLRHPAFVPRIYVALTLAKLHATEAVPAILSIIREGYEFSDSTSLASGKHGPEMSRTVRWRGFLCMALGRMGGEEARTALEGLASDAHQPRDIRYSAVVGLGFIASRKSLPALQKAASDDIIWMVRDEARRTAADIETFSQETQP